MPIKNVEKEKLVIELYKQNKTIRELAKEVHKSFKGIGNIIKKYNGETNDLKKRRNE